MIDQILLLIVVFRLLVMATLRPGIFMLCDLPVVESCDNVFGVFCRLRYMCLV